MLAGVVTAWDPNWIRKRIGVHLRPYPHSIEFRGTKLWINLNYHIGYRSYIRGEPFEMAVYTLADRMRLGPEDIILDIGANIGTASIPYCAEHGGVLIAVEASRDNAQLLCRNIFENRIKAHVHLTALADDEHAGTFLPLHIRGGNTGANSLQKEWNPSMSDPDPEPVPVTTLDGLISDPETIARIALIKIDVEGAEHMVLSGATRFLERCRAPIVMEYRNDATREFLSHDMGQTLRQLSRRYRISALDDELNEIPFDASNSYENILLRPRT